MTFEMRDECSLHLRPTFPLEVDIYCIQWQGYLRGLQRIVESEPLRLCWTYWATTAPRIRYGYQNTIQIDDDCWAVAEKILECYVVSQLIASYYQHTLTPYTVAGVQLNVPTFYYVHFTYTRSFNNNEASENCYLEPGIFSRGGLP